MDPCPNYQSNPCEVTKHEDPFGEEALLLPDDVSPSLACKLHGILEKNSQNIPGCIVCISRALLSDPDENIWGTRKNNCESYLLYQIHHKIIPP